MQSKARVSIDLDAGLVAAIDAEVKKSKQSRSSVIKSILHLWISENRRQKLERETEAYYLSLTDGEKEEDRQWVQMASEQAKNLWD